VDTLQLSILLTAYRIQLFKQMTQISHGRLYLWKEKTVSGTQNCVRWCVFVFVFQRLNTEMLC